MKFISRVDEQHMIRRLEKFIRDNEKFRIDPIDTLLINVSPDYSSIVSQNLIHFLSTDEPLDMLSLDVPYPGENYRGYEIKFLNDFKEYREIYNNFILVEAAVISGNNYTWIVNAMKEFFDINNNNILTTALYQQKDSKYKCDIVGEIFDDKMIQFAWESYNKYWDNE